MDSPSHGQCGTSIPHVTRWPSTPRKRRPRIVVLAGRHESPRKRRTLGRRPGSRAIGRGTGAIPRIAACVREPYCWVRHANNLRKDLPLSTYTEAYWKVDLQYLLHFLAADGFACSMGNPHVCRHDRRTDRAAAVSAGVGSLRRLSATRLVPHPARSRSASPPDRAAGRRRPWRRQPTKISWPCKTQRGLACALPRARRMSGEVGFARLLTRNRGRKSRR